MPNVFEVVDKTGRKVRLKNEDWSHILRHKGMEQYLEEIKNVLIKPDFIMPHKFHPEKRNYYKYYKEKGRYLLVSVRYLNGEGYVVTAFITRKIIRK